MNKGYYFILILISAVFLISGCQSRNENKQTVRSTSDAEVSKSAAVTDVDIHEAALNGNFSQVSMQLDSGVKPDTTDSDGRTPLLYAAFNGHIEIIKVLLKKRASVNHADNYGRTALMMASSGSNPESVKLLLDNYADPNLIDKEEHFTALMYAASEGQMENVKILLGRDANPLLKDIDGDDAETFARNNNHNEVADLIKSFKTKY